MKYNYPQLRRKMCKMSVGCMRLENPNFKGTNDCKYTDKPISEIKKILNIKEK